MSVSSSADSPPQVLRRDGQPPPPGLPGSAVQQLHRLGGTGAFGCSASPNGSAWGVLGFWGVVFFFFFFLGGGFLRFEV